MIDAGIAFLAGNVMHRICGLPIAIMSYNRPEYLYRVATSLKSQSIFIDDESVVLFQDSVLHPVTGEMLDVDRQAECVAAFRALFPNSPVLEANCNLGVAHNYDRAECHMFEDRDADCAIFLEDDLVLGPRYVEALLELADFATREPKVAYVAAYGQHLAPSDEQRKCQHRITHLEHKWGFAMTRRQWALQRPILQAYLDIVSRNLYVHRDEELVRSYFRELGYDVGASSQDAAKDVASLVLGTTKLNTLACFGKYIGESGVHFTPELYEAMGFAATALFEDDVPQFQWPIAEELDAIIAEQRNRFEVRNAENAIRRLG